MMNSYCDFSFADLFRAAHGRDATQHELQELYANPRAEINRIVEEWARLAGWKTKAMQGRDGETYMAFWPEENA